MAGTNHEPTRFEAFLMKTTSTELYDESSVTSISISHDFNPQASVL